MERQQEARLPLDRRSFGGLPAQPWRQAMRGIVGILCQNGGAAAEEGGGKERCPAQMPGKRAGWPAFPDVWQEEGPAGNGPRLGGKEGKAEGSFSRRGNACCPACGGAPDQILEGEEKHEAKGITAAW